MTADTGFVNHPLFHSILKNNSDSRHSWHLNPGYHDDHDDNVVVRCKHSYTGSLKYCSNVVLFSPKHWSIRHKLTSNEGHHWRRSIVNQVLNMANLIVIFDLDIFDLYSNVELTSSVPLNHKLLQGSSHFWQFRS